MGFEEKSENFNRFRLILFEFCKKKLQGGEDKFTSRNRVNIDGKLKKVY